MEKLQCDEIEYYLSNIPGVVVINMEGQVVYVNDQCANFFELERKNIIGRPIKEVFPPTKMMEGLNIDSPGLVFYNTYRGIGITAHVPLFKGNKKIGLLEYDLIQASEDLHEFSKSYSDFLNQELLNVENELLLLENAKYTINNILGKSKLIIELKQSIIAAAKSDSTVIITGETGTGKELVAHAIHNLSERRNNRLVKVNSTTLPENLVESELFGYSEGAFTGASKKGKKGKFQQADGGTIFIDEINQMPPFVQPKLLRVLQEQEVDPIGSDQAVHVNVRLVVATNESLAKLVEEKKFREDLYYRLNVIEIELPPLRMRKDDIDELVMAKIAQLNLQMGKRVKELEPSAMEILKAYDWPGNIRELHNIIERAMNFSKEEILMERDFDFADIKIKSEKSLFSEGMEGTKNIIEEVKREAEKAFIIKTLKQFDNNRSKTAKYLNIDRSLLYQKMKRLGIS